MGSPAIADIPDPALEEEEAARTARWKALEADRLEEARAALVARYHKASFAWPDGIGAWYVAMQWNDDGTRISQQAINPECHSAKSECQVPSCHARVPRWHHAMAAHGGQPQDILSATRRAEGPMSQTRALAPASPDFSFRRLRCVWSSPRELGESAELPYFVANHPLGVTSAGNETGGKMQVSECEIRSPGKYCPASPGTCMAGFPGRSASRPKPASSPLTSAAT